MLFFLKSFLIPEFSESITHADPIPGFSVIAFLTFWVILNSIHASIHTEFISQVAPDLERLIFGFMIRSEKMIRSGLEVSSVGYATPFLTSVSLTDFNLTILWFLYLLVRLVSALYILPSMHLDLF